MLEWIDGKAVYYGSNYPQIWKSAHPIQMGNDGVSLGARVIDVTGYEKAGRGDQSRCSIMK